MKSNLGSCRTPSQLAAIVKSRFKRIQDRAGLIDGFLAETGLSLEPRTTVDPDPSLQLL